MKSEELNIEKEVFLEGHGNPINKKRNIKFI